MLKLCDRYSAPHPNPLCNCGWTASSGPANASALLQKVYQVVHGFLSNQANSRQSFILSHPPALGHACRAHGLNR